MKQNKFKTYFIFIKSFFIYKIKKLIYYKTIVMH